MWVYSLRLIVILDSVDSIDLTRTRKQQNFDIVETMSVKDETFERKLKISLFDSMDLN